MRFSMFVGSLAAAALSVGVMSTAAHAQQTIIAQTSPGLVTFTGGSGGVLSVTGATTYFPRNGLAVGTPVAANITFNVSGTGTFNNTGTAFDQAFTGGTFSITSAVGGTTLLSGTFDGSVLNGTVGGTSGALTLVGNSVNYTAGSTAFPAGFSRNGGSLSLAFNTLAPFALGGGGVAAFQGIDLINYTAVPLPAPVPEPSAWMAMGMAATSVGGLMVRGKVRRRKLIAA